MAIFTYDAAQHFLIIGGVPISGFQDDSEIALEMDEDVMTRQADLDGESVTFNRSNNRMATCTFTLNNGAASNDVLSALYQDFIRNEGGVVPFMLKDGNGRSLAGSGGCAIQSLPSLGGGSEAGGREWVVGLGQTDMFIGGAAGV
ncbi:MAG: hypothetical protein IBX56_02320 [Methylomicrobium sp.]|nr:hypothetical protein [Methylomicrobium sp.]